MVYDNHKMNISQLPMSSRNETAKIISCLSERLARVENKIDAALLNNNCNHNVMLPVVGEFKKLNEKSSDGALLGNKSITSACSMSSSSSCSSGNNTSTDSSLKLGSRNHLVLTQPIVGIMPNTIKGLDVITTLTRWYQNHWFNVDKKTLSEKQKRVYYKMMQAVFYVKNFSGLDEPNYEKHDEDCMTDYQQAVKKHVDKACADILAYFCKLECKEILDNLKLSKFLNLVEKGKTCLIR